MGAEKEAREKLVRELKSEGYLKTENVIRAFGKVNRKNFVLKEHEQIAYADYPLPIPGNVTISAPHMHAIVLELLDLSNDDDVLEVGFGSGILLAYIAEIVKSGKITGTEIKKETYEFGKKNLGRCCRGIVITNEDITRESPGKKQKFDKIVVSAAAKTIPEELVKLLKNNGRMIIPVGDYFQNLVVIEKKGKKITKKNMGGVAFVPLE
ncbi:MAG: methyltransferase domain-containing protein [Candidatus Aenigmarchaeota archaeon]|nr:methyltransferase domain-containing protein [Candidatus Aenigmarchaeota archaeon]